MAAGDLSQILIRAGRRDPEALAELVERYSPRLYGLLLRLTRSREVAEDLLQETFLHVVRAIERYVDAGKFEPWLFRIAANLARDDRRRRARRGEFASLDEAEADGSGGATGPVTSGEPAADLDREEDCARLAAALDRLSDADREILLLRHYADLPFREIAELLNVPLGTALARAHRALQHLRAQIGPES